MLARAVDPANLRREADAIEYVSALVRAQHGPDAKLYYNALLVTLTERWRGHDPGEYIVSQVDGRSVGGEIAWLLLRLVRPSANEPDKPVEVIHGTPA